MTPSSKALAALLALTLAACSSAPSRQLPERPRAATSQGTASQPGTPAPAVTVKDPGERFEAALADMKAKRFAQAREGFAALAKEHPEFAGPLTNLGILDAKSDPKNAIGSFTRAAAVNPRNAMALNWLGILYREARNYPRAEENYLKAIAINPDNPAVVLNLAILYDAYLKRPDDALARYREYQRMTGNRELKVTAWIKALEAATPAPALPATPAAGNKT